MFWWSAWLTVIFISYTTLINIIPWVSAPAEFCLNTKLYFKIYAKVNYYRNGTNVSNDVTNIWDNLYMCKDIPPVTLTVKFAVWVVTGARGPTRLVTWRTRRGRRILAARLTFVRHAERQGSMVIYLLIIIMQSRKLFKLFLSNVAGRFKWKWPYI